MHDSQPRNLRRWLGLLALNSFAKFIPSKLARVRANQKTYRSLARQYGNLGYDGQWKSLSVDGLENESAQVYGAVVNAIRGLDGAINSLFLAGEPAAAKRVYASISGLDECQITAAGLHSDADYVWNFEHSPPDVGSFDCVVSHAVLEHLIDPFRHFRDLASLLNPRGNLIVFTVAPGFPYHRHPIDCVRFFPDWFETVGERTGLTIIDRYYGSERVMYRFEKPTES
jgi:SAM-dependent methyltransferase